ncbi:haloacid dehalogenase [Bacillaceae bacterium SAOS 7]|nr:haloacid dehalogenase [Bacillaceae bacterium SAOS 7]
MIFASDLDRTLIYSNRFLDERHVDLPVRSVEKYKGSDISFMTERAIALLQQLAERMIFIPVTTRTVEQYQRISLFQKEVRPEYAITCNGGVILKNGEVDRQWQDYVLTKMNESSTSLATVKRKIEETADASWLESIRVVSPFFVYLLVKPELVSLEVLKEYEEWASDHGWAFSFQGRKVYFIPKPVNKWDAVQYLSENAGKNTVFSAGDSYLDVCLVEQASFGLIPRHGEAAKNNLHLPLTQTEGILAAEEIIETMLAKVAESNIASR